MRVVLKFYVTPRPRRVHQHHHHHRRRLILDATWNAGLNCSKVNLYHERFSTVIRLCGLEIRGLARRCSAWNRREITGWILEDSRGESVHPPCASCYTAKNHSATDALIFRVHGISINVDVALFRGVYQQVLCCCWCYLAFRVIALDFSRSVNI